MSEQKIEFQCTSCQSLLRLSAEHVGKRARCPVCNSIEVITGSTEVTGAAKPVPLAPSVETPPTVQNETVQSTVQSWRAVTTETPPPAGAWSQTPDFSRPPVESPFATPQQAAPPIYVSTQTADGSWIAGTIIGSLSIVMACGCGCYGSIPALVLSGVGFLCTVFSRSPNRWVPFLLNGIGCGVGLLFLGVLGFFLVLGMMNP